MGYSKGYLLIFIDSIGVKLSSTTTLHDNLLGNIQRCSYCLRCDGCEKYEECQVMS